MPSWVCPRELSCFAAFPEPLHRLGGTLLDAVPVQVADAQRDLGVGVLRLEVELLLALLRVGSALRRLDFLRIRPLRLCFGSAGSHVGSRGFGLLRSVLLRRGRIARGRPAPGGPADQHSGGEQGQATRRRGCARTSHALGSRNNRIRVTRVSQGSREPARRGRAARCRPLQDPAAQELATGCGRPEAGSRTCG